MIQIAYNVLLEKITALNAHQGHILIARPTNAFKLVKMATIKIMKLKNAIFVDLHANIALIYIYVKAA